MSDFSPRLKLPYILPAQAQKHVPYNEAIQRVDTLSQLTVQAFGAKTPPGGPQPGQVWALGVSPVGDWAEQGGNLAVAANGGWMFIPPTEGLRAWGLAERVLKVFQNGDWIEATAALQRLERLGLSTDADNVNRLAVASEASLFSHAGQGHQLKVNKASDVDTASVLFQSNFTGHAEMGLAGDTAFGVKLSPNGIDWHEAIRADAATGEIALAPATTVRARVTDSGIELDGTLSGSAVQADPLDTTAGKVLTGGAFGLGTALPLPDGNVDQAVKGGCYQGFGGAHATPSGGDNPFAASAAPFTLTVTQSGPDQWVQIATLIDPANPQIRMRSHVTGTPGAWSSLTHGANSAGPLTDGGVVESQSLAAGRVTRYADGSMVCTTKRVQLDYDTNSRCSGTWTFPGAFATTDDLAVQLTIVTDSDATPAAFCASAAAPNASDIGAICTGALTTSSVGICLQRIRGAPNFAPGNRMFVSAVARGRWK